MADLPRLLQDEFQAVIQDWKSCPEGLVRAFAGLTLGNTGKNALLECQNGKVVLNPNHAVYLKLNKTNERARLYYLMSAIASVVNRADTKFDDSHERRFHELLLLRLLQLESESPQPT